MELQNLPTTALAPNAYNFNEMSDAQLAGLTEQVKRTGYVMHHITARPSDEEGRFIIIDGEHQWRAATAAGLATVPVQVIPLTEGQAVAETYRRNGLRGEANRVKLGLAIGRMKDLAEAEGKHLSNKQVAKMLGRTDVWVASMLAYADLAALAGSRPDFPATEAEVARLTEKQVKQFLELPEPPPGSNEAAGEATGKTEDAPPAEVTDEDKAAKRKARLFKTVATLTADERAELRRVLTQLDRQEAAKLKAKMAGEQGQTGEGEGA